MYDNTDRSIPAIQSNMLGKQRAESGISNFLTFHSYWLFIRHLAVDLHCGEYCFSYHMYNLFFQQQTNT